MSNKKFYEIAELQNQITQNCIVVRIEGIAIQLNDFKSNVTPLIHTIQGK